MPHGISLHLGSYVMACRHDASSGFTLVELIVAVAVVVLLAGVTIPIYQDRSDAKKSEDALAEMHVVRDGFHAFRDDNGIWPVRNSDTGIVDAAVEFDLYRCFYENIAGRKGWDGPYFNRGVTIGGAMQIASATDGLLDPWGRRYRICYGARKGEYEGGIAILSSGPDGHFQTRRLRALFGGTGGDDLGVVITRRL